MAGQRLGRGKQKRPRRVWMDAAEAVCLTRGSSPRAAGYLFLDLEGSVSAPWARSASLI